ncbi:unnamed protein product [Meloidogyne enterolobii]|uniref:Uncharacterized protein n=1 Tax=Meloidogyne enterolobii TaxID=390850 RepID=A0ACB0ZHV8_MELEN
MSGDLNLGLNTLATRIDTLVPETPTQQRLKTAEQNANLISLTPVNTVGTSQQQNNHTLNQITNIANNENSENEDEEVGLIGGLTFDYVPNTHGPIPIYSGESSGTFSSWAQKFLDYMEGTGQKLDEPSKIGRLKMFLDGIPRQTHQ